MNAAVASFGGLADQNPIGEAEPLDAVASLTT